MEPLIVGVVVEGPRGMLDQVGRGMMDEDTSVIDSEGYMDEKVKSVEGNNRP